MHSRTVALLISTDHTRDSVAAVVVLCCSGTYCRPLLHRSLLCRGLLLHYKHPHIHTIQILTGAEVNTEKLCPQVVQCCPRGRRPESNIAQLRGIIFQCWSRLTVNICFVISRKTGKNNLIPHSAFALPAYSNY